MSETRSATYSAADSGTVVGLDQVQEAVFVGIGHRTGDWRRCREAPAEQGAVVLTQAIRVGADDFEVHNWISHESPEPPSATVTSQRRDLDLRDVLNEINTIVRLLRRVADHEIQTMMPLTDVMTTVLGLVGA